MIFSLRSSLKRSSVSVVALAMIVAACGGTANDAAPTAPAVPAPSAPAPAPEEPEEEIYDFSGQTITVVVPFSPGGTIDLLGRLTAAELGKYLKGSPNIVVENVTGGGGAVGMLDVAARRPADGLSMVVTSTGVAFRWLLGAEGHTYPLDKMPVLASFPISLTTASSVAAVQDLEGLLSTPGLTWGANAPGASAGIANQLIAELLELDIRHIFGWDGDGDQAIAMERGELALSSPGTTAWLGTFQQIPGVVPIFQTGMLAGDGSIVRDPSIPNVPHIAEEYERVLGRAPSGPAWEGFLLLLSALTGNGALAMHPDTPAEQLEALRRATTEMVASPDWVEASIRVLGEEQQAVGPEAQEILQTFFRADQALVARLQTLTE